jgi:hypothetical protein
VTSEAGVEHVVERPFLFHCSCGAAIEMRQKKETCQDCGETVEVIRCVSTAKGKKYALRVRKRRNRWNIEPPVSPIGVVLATVHPLEAPDKHKLSSTNTTQPMRHQETPNLERRFRWLGLLMILFGALLLVPLSLSPEQLAIVMSQKPRDCDWITLPIGDKHCHYEGSAVHDNPPNGDHISVNWRRESDY